MSNQALFRASVGSALTDRLQDLERSDRLSHTTGSSNAAFTEQFELDMTYLRGLAPEYARRFNRFHSPLLRLPPEILPLILGAATSDTRYELKGWISLGHVCYDLRAALLSMHTLWADVVCDAQYARAQEELILRAGCSPISIQLLEFDALPSWFLDRVLELLPRARSITAHERPREQMEDIIRALREGSFPYLEELSLTIDVDEGEPQVVPGSVLLSRDALELAAPKLRDVHFRNIFIPVDMSSVRTLTLEWNSNDPQPVHDYRTFTAMLRRCRRLETLHLRDWRPTDYSASHIALHQGECKISLPYLRHLELLREDPQYIHAFLAFWAILDIPKTMTIHLDFCKRNLPLDHLLLLIQSLHVLIPHTQVAGVSHISQLSVSGDNEGFVEVTLGSVGRRNQSNPFEGSPMTPHTPCMRRESFHTHPLKIRVFSSDAWETPADLLAYLDCICTTLQLRVSDIDIVEFYIKKRVFHQDKHRHTNEHLLYTMFPSISRLYLDSPADIGRILGFDTTQGLDYLPNLRALHLIKWTSSDATFSLADVEHLIDTIEKRVARGKSLHALSLEGFFSKSDFGPPGVKERCLQQLTALVPHVRFEELDPDVDSEK